MSDEVEVEIAPPDTGGITMTTALFEALEVGILGHPKEFTREDVASLSGVPPERLEQLWSSLGFPLLSDNEARQFTADDLEALRLLGVLTDAGLITSETELAITRSMGRAFSRLAEWEVAEVGSAAARLADGIDIFAVEGILDQTLPAVASIHTYIWRRHLAEAAARMLLHPDAGEEAQAMCVGFADIVGFTRRSRSMSADELGDLVETFEHTVNAVISQCSGRIIKTIGDEVMFAADAPEDGARIALTLAEGHETDEEFPEVRVGVTYGMVLPRMGDVYGENVNIAARLTSLAKPGRVLVNRELAEHLELHDDEFRVRRARSSAVKGYTRLETWTLRRPKPADEESGEIEKLAEKVEKEARRMAAAARRQARREERQDARHKGEPAHLEARDVLEALSSRLPLPDVPLLRRNDDADADD